MLANFCVETLGPESPAAATVVPPLREDIRLHPAAPQRDGSPAWTLHDPVTNRFYLIGWPEFEMLSRWRLRAPGRIAASTSSETPLDVDESDVLRLAVFLQNHQLVRVTDADGVARLGRMAAVRREGPLRWLLHHYLFFRIPLVHPQAFLRGALPWIAFVFAPWFRWLVVGCAAGGLMLAARQWDTFVHTFSDTLSLEGLAGYLVALVVAKTLHELGHAFMATRLGVRVGHMGLAFLVLWPMLYTDTSESWKLADRRDRFRIAAAGMATEFALAGFATLAWSLCDDGALRSALFFLATTSWVLTVGINASPFMRFDGYFLLSDALDMPNLHDRAFAIARARMRRLLLGWSDADPEIFPPTTTRFLVAFAWITWAYRLLVFLAIAVAVYHLFFKLLGIFLFAVEIGWFVARPLIAEFSVWRARRDEIVPSRRWGLYGLLGGVFLVLVVPWRTSVHAPGWMHADRQLVVYSPLPARVASLRGEGRVAAGEAIAVLDSPDLRLRAAQYERLADALALQLDQAVGRRDGTERRALFARQWAEQAEEARSRRTELARLELRAPFAGRLTDIDHAARSGVWVNGEQPLAVLVDDALWVVDAYADQRDVARLSSGAEATFHPSGDPMGARSGRVIGIDGTRTLRLPEPLLSTAFGGAIPVLQGGEGRVPRDALYRVRVALDGAPPAAAVRGGTVVITGARRSLALDAFEGLAEIAIRESGF